MPRVHAIRVTLQRHWAIAEVRQEKSRGSLIILNDILFREFARWIQDLVRIGYSNILPRTRLAANHGDTQIGHGDRGIMFPITRKHSVLSRCFGVIVFAHPSSIYQALDHFEIKLLGL